MIALMLLLTMSTAYGEEPTFTTLKKGEPAPFNGRLLNDAAVSQFIIQDKTKVEQCNIQIEYELAKQKAALKYDYNLLSVKCEADDQRLQDMVAIKEDEINFLRKSYSPPKNQWWLAGGIVIGAASSIGIMYAVAPGLR